MLRLTNCEKKYFQRIILNIPELSLDDGVYWLQGANGSGKTTLFRMIAGMIPCAGEITLKGVNLRKQPTAYRRLVSYAEAEPMYPTFLSGRELVAFYRETRKDDTGDAESLAGLFDMNHYLAAPIGSYSSGMVKKLSLLLALIGRPSLVLLDEPLATLDAEATDRLPKLIEEYHQLYQCNFIFSSHQAIDTNQFTVDGKLVATNQTIQWST